MIDGNTSRKANHIEGELSMTTILIVDDEPSIRKYLAMTLGDVGYRVVEAADGVQALEQVQAERPDLVITDIIMPKMNGFEFVRRLRSDPDVARTSVVFITAVFYGEETRTLAQACGVTQLIAKPFKPDEVLRTVGLALSATAPAQLAPQSETFASEHLGLLTDKITQKMDELEETEKALREHECRLQALFENTQDTILFADDDARFVDANPAACALLGYSREELLRMTAWEIAPAPNRARIRDSWRKFLTVGELSGEYTVLRKDGTTREIECRGVAKILPGLHLSMQRDITERKQAESKLHEYSERLQSLSCRLLEVQEAERSRLARELHDELGQVLATVNYQLHALKEFAGPAALPRLEECSATLQRAVEQVRDLSLELRPVLLEALGLEAALCYLAEQHGQRTRQEVQVKCQLAQASLSSEQKIACFRIVQEALANAARHARANRITVELHHHETAIELVIHDDGVGFDVALAERNALKNKTFGLLGMKERVNLLDGRIDVESAPRLGTTIRVRLPRLRPSCSEGNQKE